LGKPSRTENFRAKQNPNQKIKKSIGRREPSTIGQIADHLRIRSQEVFVLGGPERSQSLYQTRTVIAQKGASPSRGRTDRVPQNQIIPGRGELTGQIRSIIIEIKAAEGRTLEKFKIDISYNYEHKKDCGPRVKID